MSFFIQGIGAVTPLGPTRLETWSALCDGQQAPRTLFKSGLANRSYYSCPVPAKFVADAARQPRLRRSGTISLLGVAAGFDAFADAGLKPVGELGARIAVVFAICSGGVNYTRRFYHEIVTQGANSCQPVVISRNSIQCRGQPLGGASRTQRTRATHWSGIRRLG